MSRDPPSPTINANLSLASCIQPCREKFGAAQGHYSSNNSIAYHIVDCATTFPYLFSTQSPHQYLCTANVLYRAAIRTIIRVNGNNDTPTIIHRDACPSWLNRILARAFLRNLYVQLSRATTEISSQCPSDRLIDAPCSSHLIISIPSDAPT